MATVTVTLQASLDQPRASARAGGVVAKTFASGNVTFGASTDVMRLAKIPNKATIIDVVGHAAPVRGTSAPRGHNAPPPPPELPATPEQIAELRKRIHALPNPDGRKALLALLTGVPLNQVLEDVQRALEGPVDKG